MDLGPHYDRVFRRLIAQNNRFHKNRLRGLHGDDHLKLADEQPDTVRVAVVMQQLGSDDFASQDGTFIHINRGKGQSLMKTLTRCVTKYRAQFVVANELAFPYDLTLKYPKGEIAEAVSQLASVCEKQKAYCIAGSFHAWRERHSYAPIFTPHRQPDHQSAPHDRHGGEVSTPRARMGEGREAVPSTQWPTIRLHRKMTSAESVGERVVVPFSNEVVSYNTEFANFSLLICSDGLQLSTMASIFGQNYASPDRRCPVLFMPGANEDGELMDQAIAMSEILDCFVVVCNSYFGKSERSAARIYFDGRYCPTDRTPSGKVPASFVAEETFDGNGSKLVVFDLQTKVCPIPARLDPEPAKEEFVAWAKPQAPATRDALYGLFSYPDKPTGTRVQDA